LAIPSAIDRWSLTRWLLVLLTIAFPTRSFAAKGAGIGDNSDAESEDADSSATNTGGSGKSGSNSDKSSRTPSPSAKPTINPTTPAPKPTFRGNVDDGKGGVAGGKGGGPDVPSDSDSNEFPQGPKDPGCCEGTDVSHKQFETCFDIETREICDAAAPEWGCAWKAGDDVICGGPKAGCCYGTDAENDNFEECYGVDYVTCGRKMERWACAWSNVNVPACVMPTDPEGSCCWPTNLEHRSFDHCYGADKETCEKKVDNWECAWSSGPRDECTPAMANADMFVMGGMDPRDAMKTQVSLAGVAVLLVSVVMVKMVWRWWRKEKRRREGYVEVVDVTQTSFEEYGLDEEDGADKDDAELGSRVEMA